MLFKIRCNPVHPLCGAPLAPNVPVWVTRGTLVAHRCIHVPRRCRTSQYLKTFKPISVSLWNDFEDPVFDGVGRRVTRAGPMLFYWPTCSLIFVFYCFPSLFFVPIGWYCGAGVFELIWCNISPNLLIIYGISILVVRYLNSVQQKKNVLYVHNSVYI